MPTQSDRQQLTLLAVIQVTRVPSFRDRVDRFFGEVGEVTFRMAALDMERFRKDMKESGAAKDMSDEEVEEWRRLALDPDAFKFRGNPAASLKHGLIAAFDALAPMLLRMRWAFLVAPDAAHFITSDNPTFWHNPKARGFYGRGLASRDAEVFFALNSGVALLGTWEGPEGAEQVGSEKVAIANHIVSAYAHCYVFASVQRDGRTPIASRWHDDSHLPAYADGIIMRFSPTS